MGEQEGGVKAWACMTFDFTGSQKSSVYTGATEKTYMCIDKWDFVCRDVVLMRKTSGAVCEKAACQVRHLQQL